MINLVAKLLFDLEVFLQLHRDLNIYREIVSQNCLSFCFTDIYQHVGIRVVWNHFFSQLASRVFKSFMLRPINFKVCELSTKALSEGIVFGDLGDLSIVELKPSVVQMRPNESVIMSIVKSSPMYKNGVEVVSVGHFVVLLSLALAESVDLHLTTLGLLWQY